jgi:hypothetical protein
MPIYGIDEGRATKVKAICMIYAIALNITALGLLGWNY